MARTAERAAVTAELAQPGSHRHDAEAPRLRSAAGVPSLVIEHPATYLPERAYAFDVVFGHFLGLPYEARCSERSDVRIVAAEDDGRALILPDVLFQTPVADWLTPRSMPVEPLRTWQAPDWLAERIPGPPHVPALYAREAGEAAYEPGRCIRLAIDLLGGAFWFLTRYEEPATGALDARGRFPATASLAYRQGLLDRPLVNEYVEILWAALSLLWPSLERKSRAYQVAVSHDVDWPLYGRGRRPLELARAMAGDVTRRREPTLALRRARSMLPGAGGASASDPYDTFDFLLDCSERAGIQTAFYFIAGHTGGSIDGNYHIDEPWVRRLLRRIADRGHEIGLHPSYQTFQDQHAMAVELHRLRTVIADEGLGCEVRGGRQHYLRWRNPTTWRIWDDLGLAYDATLSFADHVGFRCGTCDEYPVFDLQARRALGLRERPLIVMETTLFAYMGLSWDVALEQIGRLSDACRRYQGTFTLLWHNDSLASAEQRRHYQNALERILP